MITFYITSRIWENQDVELLDYSFLTEAGLANMIKENPNGLILVAPSPFSCAFREKFIDPNLDKDGYICEGMFKTSLNGVIVDFRLIENINMKLAREKGVMKEQQQFTLF